MPALSPTMKDGILNKWLVKVGDTVKAGDIIEKEEMSNLVNRLFSTDNPYYCPHGRPIVIKLTEEELDKRFERK